MSLLLRAPWPLMLTTWNIHGAVGHDGRFDPSRIAAVLKEINADIIALQEVPLGGRHWPNVLHKLERALGLVGVAGPTFDVGGRHFGNAILSRYPILSTRRIDLSFGSQEPRGALDADIYGHGCRMRVVATHLGLRAAERTAQVQRLLQCFDTAEMPVILMGDVNEWFVWGRPLSEAFDFAFSGGPCASDISGHLPAIGAGSHLDTATSSTGSGRGAP